MLPVPLGWSRYDRRCDLDPVAALVLEGELEQPHRRALSDSLGAAPLLIPIVIGIVAVSVSVAAVVVARSAASIVKAWKAGEISNVEARRRMGNVVEELLQQFNRGKITSEDYSKILDAVRRNMPDVPTPAGSAFGKYGTAIVVGVATSVLAALLLRGLGGR